MTIRRCKSGPLALCLGLVCSWPAAALGQDCSDETKLLSEEWFLTKVDCGADKLIDAGVNHLSAAGLNLAEAVLDQYLPPLSDLLFDDDDQFARDFADLKLHMEAQSNRIINEMLWQRTRTSTLQLQGAMNDMRDFSNDPMHVRAVNLSRISGVDDVLEGLALDLMWPRAADWSTGIAFDFNFAQMAPPDVDRFHALMTTTGLRVEAFPMQASAEYYAAIVDDLDQPTPEELADVQAQSHSESLTDLSNLLFDLQRYIDAVSSKNLFRLRSDQRFSSISASQYCGTFVYAYSKAPIGGDPLAEGSEHYGFLYFDDGLQGTFPSCFGTYSGVGSYRIVKPDGTETTGRTGHAAFTSSIQLGYGANQVAAYESFLLGAYGAARPAISGWYRTANQTPPEVGIDLALRTALRAQPSVATVLNGLSNLSNAPLSANDWRAAEDMILESTTGSIWVFGLSAGADYLNDGGPHPLRVVQRFLHREAGAEVFREMAAAKFAAITPS